MSSAEKLQAGDVVQVKSGGPPMTVHSVSDLGEVECIWFWKENQESPQRVVFKESVLERVGSADYSARKRNWLAP